MKRHLFNVVPLLAQLAISQNARGSEYSSVYLGANDFIDGIPTYTFLCCGDSGEIHMNHYLSPPVVDVTVGERYIRLNKNCVFGYRVCEHNDYRFNVASELLYMTRESRRTVDYVANVHVRSSSRMSLMLAPCYVFSSTLRSVILPVAVANGKKLTTGEGKCRDALDILIYSNDNLISIDSVDHIFKHNALFSKAVTN